MKFYPYYRNKVKVVKIHGIEYISRWFGIEPLKNGKFKVIERFYRK